MNFVVYRDAVCHKRGTTRVKGIIEKGRPSKPVKNRGMGVLAFSGAVCN